MNRKCRKSKIILITTIAILFSGVYASADGGRRGYGSQRGMYQGQGWHHRGYGGFGCGTIDNLSEDDIKKLDAERTEFFEATKDLRRKIYQKRLELASELAKENPDAAVAAAVQTDISDLKAQMAQKRLDHFLRVQKINPDLGRGFWGGGHMGPGMIGPHRGSSNSPFGGPGGGYYGMGPGRMGPRGGYGMGPGMMYRGMMGPGGEGSWGSSDCPFGGPGGGYGMGPRGGYGMGPGYGRGPGMMGPGWSDPDDDPRQYNKKQGTQTE